MAVALAAVALCSSSAETGGAMMFKYPGVNCISESVPEDGAWSHSNPLNPVEYRGTAVENAPSIPSPALPPVDSEVEVFCPIPYLHKLVTEKYGVVNLKGSSGLDYYEVQAFVDDNNPGTSFVENVVCMVLATDGEVAEGESTFDWERSQVVVTNSSVRQTALRWLMLGSVGASRFLTLHCRMPASSGGYRTQIIGYGLKKARLDP
jgi:hypothetical protein